MARAAATWTSCLKECGAQVRRSTPTGTCSTGDVPTPEGDAIKELARPGENDEGPRGAGPRTATPTGSASWTWTGRCLTPNEFLPLLLRPPGEDRKWKSGVVVRERDDLALFGRRGPQHNLELRETPVGFKYIGESWSTKNSVYPSRGGHFILGGEESGGLSLKGHVPEKDGGAGVPPGGRNRGRDQEAPAPVLGRLAKGSGDLQHPAAQLPPDEREDDGAQGKTAAEAPTKFGALAVRRIVDTDGHKFILTDGSWIGLRLSGTEPVVRVYLEADSPAKLKALEKAGRSLAGVA